MVQTRCLEKRRAWNSSKIESYIIQDTRGIIKEFKSDELKEAIRKKKLNVVNLTLTSDNRLIDTKPKYEVPKGKAPQITYETVIFFNRALLEMSDHRESTRNMLISIINGQKANNIGVFSARCDVGGMYEFYLQNKDKIPVDAVKAVLNKGNNKYTQLYNAMIRYFMARKNASDAFFVKLCEITGKPLSFVDTMKSDLYCLYNEYIN